MDHETPMKAPGSGRIFGGCEKYRARLIVKKISLCYCCSREKRFRRIQGTAAGIDRGGFTIEKRR